MKLLQDNGSKRKVAAWYWRSLAGSVALLGLASSVAAEHSGLNFAPTGTVRTVAYAPDPQLEGRLAIAGSDTMRPLLTRLAGDFVRQHPRVKIAVEGTGSSQAIREFVIGLSGQRRGDKSRGTGHEGAAQANILASSRELTADEVGKFSSRFGYEPLVMPIALDAVALYVHKNNPLRVLTLEQVDAIFGGSHSGNGKDVTTWDQLGVKELENQPIHLYGRDKRSGTHDFFQAVALGGGRIKSSVVEEPGSASLVLSIARDPLGIGYAGVGFAISDVRALALSKDSGGQGVLPTLESVSDGSYPMRRSLYLYVNQNTKEKFNPVLLQFLNYIMSERGQEIVVSMKAYPLPQTMLTKNLALLAGSVADVRKGSGKDGARGDIEVPVF